MNELEESILNQFKILDDLKARVSKLDVKKSKIEMELEQVVNKMWEDYELTPSNVEGYKKPEDMAKANKKATLLREEIKSLRKCTHRFNRRV